ncbi:MAG: PQQ-dependent sugar dehydrogenase [Nesterenkonia sp.]|nr:PQQ-dependent sugar dehydrogenase [Nesterenkonia sp.]
MPDPHPSTGRDARRPVSRLLTVGALTMVVSACGPGGADGADGRGPSPETGSAEDAPFEITEHGTYDSPWALEFLPDSGRMLVTTRTGEMLLREPDGSEEVHVSGVPDDIVVDGQGGLGDVIVGPDFEDDGVVYLSWVTAGGGGTGAVVGRASLSQEDDSARLDDLEVIWEQRPKTDGSGHFAHRMTISPDGEHLFVTSGDRQELDPAQDLDSGLGKTMRLTPDGDPAPGNPFADHEDVSADVAEEIWTYGHRNALGIAFAPDGRLWSSEMGPAGGDELNLLEEGGNYGWPEASDGSHYGGEEIPDHTDDDGFVAPQVSWTPSISPGSLMIYQGDAFDGWSGDAFLGALSGEALVRVELDGTEAVEQQIWDMGARIRDVAEAPDGSIWLIEDGDQARLLQLTPPG